MNDLHDLYQDLILDHSKHPRNCYVLRAANRKAEGYNPLCGDRITIYLEMNGECIKNISFQGSGCAISTASTSMLTEFLKGKTLVQAEQLFRSFHQMMTQDGQADLGKLRVFQGVREFPMRVKCATLPWHTFNAALENSGLIVSTEE